MQVVPLGDSNPGQWEGPEAGENMWKQMLRAQEAAAHVHVKKHKVMAMRWLRVRGRGANGRGLIGVCGACVGYVGCVGFLHCLVCLLLVGLALLSVWAMAVCAGVGDSCGRSEA